MEIRQRRLQFIFSIAGLLTMGMNSPTFAGEGTKRAVIVTPGLYQNLAPAPYLNVGATALQKQLQAAGFETENILLLTDDVTRSPGLTSAQVLQQLNAVVNLSQQNDLLIVAVAGHGVHIAGSDYLCLTRTTAAEILPQANEPTTRTHLDGHLLSVQELTETISIAAGRKLLIVDTSGGRSPFVDETNNLNGLSSSQQFGSQVLHLGDETWAIFSRSGRLTESTQESPVMTRFMRSVLEGLALHADTNRDQSVSLLELSDYLHRFSVLENSIPPVFQGKLNVDFSISPTTRVSGADALPESERQLLFKNARDLAVKALLVEQDNELAMEALDRAAQYANTKTSIAELANLKRTMLAANGRLFDAWRDAQLHGEPLLVLVPQASNVFENEVARTENRNVRSGRQIVRQRFFIDPVVGQISPGMMVRVTEISSSRLRFDLAFDRINSESEVQFVPNDKTKGWLPLSLFGSNDGNPSNVAATTN